MTVRRSLRLLAALMLVAALTSCTAVRYSGISRFQQYEIASPDVPASCDGYRIAFATDFHLPSKYRERQLHSTVRAINHLDPDLLLLGGDYQEDCDHVEPLFAALAECAPRDGVWGVMGNNDYERCTDDIRESMSYHGMHCLEGEVVEPHDSLFVVGVSWNAHPDGPHAQQEVALLNQRLDAMARRRGYRAGDEPFVLFLTHTPDHAELADVRSMDVALAGHTHGGQVTLFRLWAPVTASRYGKRFLLGRNPNSRGVPVITSGGLGTSSYPIRFCAPTDIVLLTLRRTAKAADGTLPTFRF